MEVAAVWLTSGRPRRPIRARSPGLRRHPLVSSWRPERGPRAAPAARAIATPWPRRSNGQYPRTRSGYGGSYPPAATTPDRSGANSLLDCATNERSPSKPHSPVGRAVHAARCGRHDRLGRRRRTHRSPAPGASARITEMTRAERDAVSPGAAAAGGPRTSVPKCTSRARQRPPAGSR
jgi:hypothetical protein